jgi:hypothetical protein
MEHHKVETGTVKQTMNDFQRHAKSKGESYTTTVTHLLGIHRNRLPNHVSLPYSHFFCRKTADTPPS